MSSLTSSQSAGSLTIIGSGIASVAHLTLQALSAIENATKVFYVIQDPVTEAYVRSKNSNYVDLFQYYDNAKPRIDTYVQMSEAMLQEVRAGSQVVGVFYGHPAVFVCPSHRAVAIAKEEGYSAKILPGISAEDCLYADLSIDPAVPGCQMFEATDYLIREKATDVTSHLILWQIGAIGQVDYNFAGYSNHNLVALADRLERDYGADHTIVHYIAANLPFHEPTIAEMTVSMLRSPDAAKQINASSTLYVPPASLKAVNADIAKSLGMTADEHKFPRRNGKQFLYPHPRWGPLKKQLTGEEPGSMAYGETEKAAVAAMATHTPPGDYCPLQASGAFVDTMTTLALDPVACASFLKDPHAYAEGQGKLTGSERTALESQSQNEIWSALRGGSDFHHKNDLTIVVVIIG